MEYGELTYKGAVYPWHCDHMNHMNVMWYAYLFDKATWRFFDSMSMSLKYCEEQGAGAFALEHHTRYMAEVRLGQTVVLRTRVISRTQKRFHFMHFMTIENGDRLAATAEFVGMHIDRTTRRSSPLPGHIAEAFDRLIAKHQTLDWDPPICGVMNP